MDLKRSMIMEAFRASRPDFLRLGDIVTEKLRGLMEKSGIKTVAVEHRVKAEDSLAGKLERKGERYSSLADITDLLGARIICYYSDDVDRIGKLVEESFDIDWENFTDKRAQIQADRFGYLSLHYICMLPKNAGYPAELCEKKFEIQIRTNLQHTWSVIWHSMGYKTEFGVPRTIVREVSRIACLLEVADEEFVRARDSMAAYNAEVHRRIVENMADDLPVDSNTLREYMNENKNMRAFLKRLAALSGAEILNADPESYIEQLMWLGVKTLGDLQRMLAENAETALTLAKRVLTGSELDILSSTAALYYLCRAELLNRRCSEEQAVEFLRLSTGSEERARRQAQALRRGLAQDGGPA